MTRLTKKHSIDYKKELETASRGMIMIHDPKLLIKLILRMIVSKVRIEHAGMILYEPRKDTYVLNISRGKTGMKIPAGFARFDRNNPVIRIFSEKKYRSLMVNKSAILVQDLNKLIWQEIIMNGHSNGCGEILHQVGDQMKKFNVSACVPAKYKNKLMAVLLLGAKHDGGSYTRDELDFFAALASDAAMAIRNAQLFADLKRESEKNHDLFIRMTFVLSSAIEAKDKYTRGHTERVTNYSILIAKQMVERGYPAFSDEFYEDLYLGGILHDIGKIGVPEAILNKITPLTDEEFDIIRAHPQNGINILAHLTELKRSMDGVLYHHERYDGNGYPAGLKGEDIPMIASIIAVADAFDAMSTDRPYRRGLSREEAVEEIDRNIKKQFHPAPARALIDLHTQGKI